MKTTILAVVLGIMVSGTPAHGQGSIIFSNLGTTTDAIVTFNCCGNAIPVDSSWTAGLAYGFGQINDPAQLILSGITQSFNLATPGYFSGPIATIPDYSGGPITFQVLAYSGTDYFSSVQRGASVPFTLPSIATGTTLPGEFGPGLQPIRIELPEPGTIALVGLGLVSLLFSRCKDWRARRN